MKYLMMSAAALALAACAQESPSAPEASEPVAAPEAEDTAGAPSAEERLDAALAEQDDAVKARYDARHPKETLMFFGVKPGMTVVDSLPGAVWYTGILADYLGPDGRVIAADYSMDMWPLFGGFATEEWIAERSNWPTTFVERVDENREEGDAPVSTFVYGSLPEDMHGEADVVLMVRAAHHFNRFEDDGGFFTEALEDAMNVLKPGGVLVLCSIARRKDIQTNGRQVTTVTSSSRASFHLLKAQGSSLSRRARSTPIRTTSRPKTISFGVCRRRLAPAVRTLICAPRWKPSARATA